MSCQEAREGGGGGIPWVSPSSINLCIKFKDRILFVKKMCTLIAAVFSLFLFLYSSSDASTDCVESLHDVELSLKSNSYNLESIDYGFFPPNSHPSFWVTVNYYFNTSTFAHDGIAVHPAAFEAQYTGSPYCNDTLVPDLQFYWTESPLLHYIDPSIIGVLSGVLYMEFNDLTIHIVIPPICGDNPVKDRWILNTITTKVNYHIQNTKGLL